MKRQFNANCCFQRHAAFAHARLDVWRLVLARTSDNLYEIYVHAYAYTEGDQAV